MLQGLNNSLPLNNVNKSAQPAPQQRIAFRGNETTEGFGAPAQPEEKKSSLKKWLAIGIAGLAVVVAYKKWGAIKNIFKKAEKEGENLLKQTEDVAENGESLTNKTVSKFEKRLKKAGASGDSIVTGEKPSTTIITGENPSLASEGNI